MANNVDEPRPEEDNESLAGKAYELIDCLILLLMWMFSLVAVAVFFTLLSLGCIEFFKAFAIGWGFKAAKTAWPADEPLIDAIKGLEFVFLSPLCYFLIRSLARQVLEYLDLGSPGCNAKADLVEVKSLIVGLLGSVLAANLVGRAIATNQPVGYSWVELTLFVVLCAYYFCMHLMARYIRRNGESNE